MEYQIDDKQLDASVFLSLVNQVWPNDYDVKQTEKALAAFASLQMDISSARSPSCSSLNDLLFLCEMKRSSSIRSSNGLEHSGGSFSMNEHFDDDHNGL